MGADREYLINEDRWIDGDELAQYRNKVAMIRAADPYRACRQDIFNATRAYPIDIRIKALEKTLEDERGIS
jgi:hypothetical protein